MTDRDTDSFVQQVEEEVRREQWSKFWKRWGVWIGAGLASIILGVAAFEVYKAVSQSGAAGAGEQFTTAQARVAEGKTDEAQAIFKQLSESGPNAYRVAALAERAAGLERNGQLEDAAKAFQEAARLADSPALKQSAELRAAYIAAEFEAFPALEARLKPLIDAGGPFSFAARELLAVEAAEAGKTDVAEREFTFIRDAIDAPTSLQQRAAQFLLALMPTTPGPAAAPAAPSPATTPAPPAAPAGDKK